MYKECQVRGIEDLVAKECSLHADCRVVRNASRLLLHELSSLALENTSPEIREALCAYKVRIQDALEALRDLDNTLEDEIDQVIYRKGKAYNMGD